MAELLAIAQPLQGPDFDPERDIEEFSDDSSTYSDSDDDNQEVDELELMVRQMALQENQEPPSAL